MKLVKILIQAEKGYKGPELSLRPYYHPKTGVEREASGDSLALFVVRQINETYNPNTSDKKQKEEALQVIEDGINDLINVRDSLRSMKIK